MSLVCSVRARRGDFLLDVAFGSDARIIGIEGPSGAGKTTLLHALAGLTPAERLSLTLNGEPVFGVRPPPPHARGLGYVFQDARLFPHLTVAGNIAYARRFSSTPVDPEPILRMLDLNALSGRWVRNLSGGETRRVAIARALCAGPRLLLLDEPFSGLDEDRRAELVPHLRRLRDEIDLPMLLVSHDPRDMAVLAEDRVRIEAGRVVQPATSLAHAT